ncbi:MAG: hypothetical protein KIS73_01165 [Enhydrobacter sp.]|nr:hypothetical protein [Enhydrobacter sp.]
MQDAKLSVDTSFRLAYALTIKSHKVRPSGTALADIEEFDSRSYETDLLIAETTSASWTPRVVVEFKFDGVTTHDVLTYSAKAATHKRLYPHLRYGLVIGKRKSLLPKLLWHGHDFDFMLMLSSEAMEGSDRDQLCRLLKEEVEASRTLSRLLTGNPKAHLFHRKLIVSER